MHLLSEILVVVVVWVLIAIVVAPFIGKFIKGTKGDDDE